MKKFLLLIVGVLFALSANAAKAWTIYANVSAKGWENVWLRYGSDFSNNKVQGWIVDPVNKIYKFQFEQDGTFDMCFTNFDGKFESTSYGSNTVGTFGTNNNGENGYWKIVNNALYTFKENDNGTSTKPEDYIYTEQPAVYLVGTFGGNGYWDLPKDFKFKGTWSSNDDDFSFTLDLAAAGITSINPSVDYFSIINCNDNKWHRRCGDGTGELEKGVVYQTWDTWTEGSENITVKETINNPVITLNSKTWKIKITEKAPEYTYYIHSNFSGSWPADNGSILMTKQTDGTWTWEGTITKENSNFGIKRLSAGEGLSGNNTWIYCNSTESYTFKTDGQELGCAIKGEATGSDFAVTLTGKYKITFNPTAMTVKLESTATPDPTGGFTYAIHGQILGKSDWDTYEMKQISNGANWWYLEGEFVEGSFGIKKLKDGKQWNGDDPSDTGNTNGWIRSNEEANKDGVTIITPGESWHAAVVETPSHNGTGNWKLSGLETSTKYTIMFNADDLQILVSTVAASGVEDINVDEDAPVEYFNLQGQRVNGELTPGIYIRRQGSTVTKVRF